VFLVGANRGLFPINYAVKDKDIAEEKRLFYVAITRAKDSLHISYFSEPSEFIALIDSRS
jgi:DNA helicase-2/ATP-dependent DNA helicase PcrA